LKVASASNKGSIGKVEPKASTGLSRLNSLTLKGSVNEAIFSYFNKSKAKINITSEDVKSSRGFTKKGRITSFIELDADTSEIGDPSMPVKDHEILNGQAIKKKSEV
jgi:hypothetical protein